MLLSVTSQWIGFELLSSTVYPRAYTAAGPHALKKAARTVQSLGRESLVSFVGVLRLRSLGPVRAAGMPASMLASVMTMLVAMHAM